MQFGMEQAARVSTPEQPMRDEDYDFNKPIDMSVDVQQYQSMIGASLHASQSTRPDISHAVGMLSRYLSNPQLVNVIAAKRVLRYLVGTGNMGLFYKRNENMVVTDGGEQRSVHVQAYSDADWAGDKSDRKSTTGYVLQVNGCVVSWGVKKQSTVALSTAEAEYMAVSLTIQEIIWFIQLLNEMMFKIDNTMVGMEDMNKEQHESSSTITLWCDNQAAVSIGTNDTHHQRTKHIDIRHHFVRDIVKYGIVQLKWIATQYQIADVLTKALGAVAFTRIRDQIVSVVKVKEEEQNKE